MRDHTIRPWRWTVRKKGGDYDITGRRFVLWGCGKYIYEFTHDLQLDDFLVVDSDENKQGKHIHLNNKKYVINSPDVLNEIRNSDYYIIITVQNEEIINAIEKLVYNQFPRWKDNLCDSRLLNREYTDITSACTCDPFIHKKIFEGRISIKLPEYIKCAENILENHLGPVDKSFFSVVRQSSRIIFRVNYENSIYFLYFPYCKDYYHYYYEENLRQNYEIRKRLHINEELVLYEDGRGFMLSRYMESYDDFSDQNVAKKVLEGIREIHNCHEKIGVTMTIHGGVEELEKKLMGEHEKYDKWFYKLHNTVIPETKNYEEKLIHGDLSYGNVLHNDECMEIIDWSFMEMGDPMFDVCLFFYFISLHWNYDFYDVICMYYDRTPSEPEYKHALAWLIFITYWKYLEEAERHGTTQKEILCKLKKLLDEY